MGSTHAWQSVSFRPSEDVTGGRVPNDRTANPWVRLVPPQYQATSRPQHPATVVQSKPAIGRPKLPSHAAVSQFGPSLDPTLNRLPHVAQPSTAQPAAGAFAKFPMPAFIRDQNSGATLVDLSLLAMKSWTAAQREENGQLGLAMLEQAKRFRLMQGAEGWQDYNVGVMAVRAGMVNGYITVKSDAETRAHSEVILIDTYQRDYQPKGFAPLAIFTELKPCVLEYRKKAVVVADSRYSTTTLKYAPCSQILERWAATIAGSILPIFYLGGNAKAASIEDFVRAGAQ